MKMGSIFFNAQPEYGKNFSMPKIFTNGSPVTISQKNTFLELPNIHHELHKGYGVLRIPEISENFGP